MKERCPGMAWCKLADVVRTLSEAGQSAAPEAEVLARVGDVEIDGMAFDSRDAAPGCLFA